jgi:ubiquinone/menaquinone biosynthesis C-methylase UbiE
MGQGNYQDQPVASQDWLWSLVICPKCGSALKPGETDRIVVCTNERCGYRSERAGRLFNLLPEHLDKHQIAENDFRIDIMNRLARSVRDMNESQRATFRMLNVTSYYAFTSQYFFFRDYFINRHQLHGRGLEIGGATGQCSGFIKLFYSDIEMITSDVAPVNMELAERLAERLQFETDYFVMADAENLPFAPGSFDFIFCSGMLHHLGNLRKALQAGYTLLKPEGRWYIVNELSIGTIPRAVWNSPWGSKGKWARKTGIRENSYTFKEWLRLFEEEEFKVVDIHFHTNPRHKLVSWSRAAYYALISKLPSMLLRAGIPCEVNFVLEKR